MRIRMVNGTDSIEWTLLTVDRNGDVGVKQVDRMGTHRVSFPSADIAGAWIIEQCNFARMEMGFRYSYLV